MSFYLGSLMRPLCLHLMGLCVVNHTSLVPLTFPGPTRGSKSSNYLSQVMWLSFYCRQDLANKSHKQPRGSSMGNIPKRLQRWQRILNAYFRNIYMFVKQKSKLRHMYNTHMQPRNLVRSLFGFSHSIILVNVKGLNSET